MKEWQENVPPMPRPSGAAVYNFLKMEGLAPKIVDGEIRISLQMFPEHANAS